MRESLYIKCHGAAAIMGYTWLPCGLAEALLYAAIFMLEWSGFKCIDVQVTVQTF